MEKKIKRLVYFILINVVFNCNIIYAQSSSYKIIAMKDSSLKNNFTNTFEIILIAKKLNNGITNSYKFKLKDCSVFIIEYDKCSGRYCPQVYTYEYNNYKWEFINYTHYNLGEELLVVKEDSKNKIVFKTKTRILDEFSF